MLQQICCTRNNVATNLLHQKQCCRTNLLQDGGRNNVATNLLHQKQCCNKYVAGQICCRTVAETMLQQICCRTVAETMLQQICCNIVSATVLKQICCTRTNVATNLLHQKQ